ncbi:MAG TPA: type II toxin-antitoxin system RelE/ParE family toxin [Gammaproteobacteria bacterium]|nr:type II toxin-antitoxin system RelE/ParE family toxin [Gammaproteobacteria bacterium]
MIKSWQHKGLKQFFETGNKSGIIVSHEKKLKIILQRLSGAIRPEDMNTPGMQFHKLIGNLSGFYSVSINGNWRVIFKFYGCNAEAVNYIDYH